jgi:hypothetical protein
MATIYYKQVLAIGEEIIHKAFRQDGINPTLHINFTRPTINHLPPDYDIINDEQAVKVEQISELEFYEHLLNTLEKLGIVRELLDKGTLSLPTELTFDDMEYPEQGFDVDTEPLEPMSLEDYAASIFVQFWLEADTIRVFKKDNRRECLHAAEEVTMDEDTDLLLGWSDINGDWDGNLHISEDTGQWVFDLHTIDPRTKQRGSDWKRVDITIIP